MFWWRHINVQMAAETRLHFLRPCDAEVSVNDAIFDLHNRMLPVQRRAIIWTNVAYC